MATLGHEITDAYGRHNLVGRRIPGWALRWDVAAGPARVLQHLSAHVDTG
jgi:hypothetical protein